MSLPDQIEVRTTLGNGSEVLAGELYINRTGLSFQYAASYINNPLSYELAPAIPLTLGVYPLQELGPFSDAAPDRWGRKLLQRSLGRSRLSEIEYLLGVNDLTRQGAYRFFLDGEPLSGSDGVPVLTDLPGLLNTADAVEEGVEVSETALRRLYRATGSLGGARPKASVRDGGNLWLAKFPKPLGDRWDVIGWEAVTLELAQKAGISVPQHRVLSIADEAGRKRTILLTQRFDRSSSEQSNQLQRIPYISAMTALDASDGQGGDWLDFADFAASIGADTRQLWLRAAFGSVIGNLDDHLRNHGFLRIGKSWQLAPAFDLNPEPYEGSKAEVHQLSLFGNPSPSLASFMQAEALSLFQVTADQAAQYLAQIRAALAQVTPLAHVHRLDAASQEIMASRWQLAQEQIDSLMN